MTPLALAFQPPASGTGASGWDSAWLLVATVLVSVLSGLASGWLSVRMTRKQYTGDRVRSDVDRVLDALGELRQAYRTRAFGEEIADLAIARREDDLQRGAAPTTQPVVAAARDYIEIGRAYASRDPDTGEAAEEAAYELLTAALVAERKAYG